MLMEYIEKTGSMQEACLEMGLSYSKGAKMIKMAEKQLGYRLLERRIGGSGKAEKDDVADGVRRILKLPADFEFKSDDASDAAAIGLAFAIENGLIKRG